MGISLKDVYKYNKPKQERKMLVPAVKDPAFIDLVRNAIQSIGMHHVTLDKVKKEIMKMDLQRIPCTDTIWKIMRSHFGLTYKMRCAANIRYSDDKFYDKRLWVSRLLA